MIGNRYDLVREIGRGGMGAVWLARDTSLDREVAIKQVGLVPGTDTADEVRAHREAVLGARVNSPHVVTVLDLVSEDDQHWLVMEHVGPSLAQRIRENGPLGADEVAPILAQAADALAAAHEAGIVHRDVKPSNLLVASDGTAKLSDFGVARGTDSDATITKTGLVTGSPAYLAPEVASGGPATPASDIWGLGATLVHTVTGRPPYDVDQANPLATLYRIVHDKPPRPAAAGWLAPLVAATMTHDPQERWSAAEARDFLRSHGRTVPADATRPMAAAATTMATLVTRAAPHAAAGSASGFAAAPPTDVRRRRFVLVAAALAVATLTTLAFVLGMTMVGEDPENTAGGASTTAAGSDQQDDPGQDDQSPSGSLSEDEREDLAKDLEKFVEDYLETAPEKPEDGFDMLTPQFQSASGGLEGYRGWWATIRRTEVLDVRPDPERLRVTYDYRYEFHDGRSGEETVTLQLVRDGDDFLIAGEA